MLYRSAIAPTVFITGGMLINNSKFEQDLQEKLLSGIKVDFHTDIDDYLQYAPIAELYIADLFGAKSKNHWFDQTRYLLISNLITSGITHGLKNMTMKDRPNGAPYAFPSRHLILLKNQMRSPLFRTSPTINLDFISPISSEPGTKEPTDHRRAQL